jgi:hypothetical protein
MKKRNKVVPNLPETSVPERKMALRMVANESFFDEDEYKFNDEFKPGNPSQFRSVHTVPELMECLSRDTKIEAEGVFLEANEQGVYRYRKIKNRAQLQEVWDKNKKLRKFREAKIREDAFAGDNAGLVGDDYVPLLGGPFNKQPYLYDYLRAHSYCFFEYHHHPMARAIVHITRDFVLGGGYRIDCEDERATALWRAFEKVNKLEEMMEKIVVEGSTYGENLIWWLPNSEVYIGYNDAPGQEPQQGLIPRIRLCDPSTCWEIVTFPEDITRVLYYQFVFPTQYQIYTGSVAGHAVPTSKFIMQQIAADDMMHFKYNCMSNEKRGRSDLFPVLGYLKWLRDLTNYKLIAAKKQSAWTEDIVVEGSQADVDNLAQSLAAMGEFEPAGSRFIHTDKIKREYLETKMAAATGDGAFDLGMNMISAGTQIPVTYFGLSGHSGGSTRAGALVGTEPVAKKFERRQLELKRILQMIWDRFQTNYGIVGAECKITFPEIITQDRSAKLKDIKFVEDCGYIARETAAPMAVKELDVDGYDYNEETAKIAQEKSPPLLPTLGAPLTAPAAQPSGSAPSGGATPPPNTSKPSAVTQNEKRTISMQAKT